jgi:uncharacterized membrane protein
VHSASRSALEVFVFCGLDCFIMQLFIANAPTNFYVHVSVVLIITMYISVDCNFLGCDAM